jgi:hypothetical protein
VIERERERERRGDEERIEKNKEGKSKYITFNI